MPLKRSIFLFGFFGASSPFSWLSSAGFSLPFLDLGLGPGLPLGALGSLGGFGSLGALGSLGGLGAFGALGGLGTLGGLGSLGSLG